MNSLQEPDQVTYSFLFIITPLQIVSTKSIKNLKKSLLLKLGDRTQKTSELNKPMEIPVDVLYSKTLKKYCPIKGIIKVYDINLDGSEVISSVGGFQTEEILNEQKNNVIIERDVGTSKIKMKIEIKNLGTVKGKTQKISKQESVKKQEYKSPLSGSRTRENVQQVQPVALQKGSFLQTSAQRLESVNQNENKKEKATQFIRRSTPISGVSSLQSAAKIVDAKKMTSESTRQQPTTANQDKKTTLTKRIGASFTENQLKLKQTKKPQIISPQQNKNLQSLQKNNDKSDQQLTILKQIVKQSQKEKEGLIIQFEKVVNGLETKNGKIWIQKNEKDKTVSLKYKEKGFERTFNVFVEFMIFQLSRLNGRVVSLREDEKSLSSVDLKLQSEIKHLTEQLSRKTNQIFTLRAKQRQKAITQPKQKSIQLVQLQNRFKDLQTLNKTLKQENDYLRQKDQTMQQIVTERQNQIEILKQEITQIDLQFKEMECTVKNDGCEIQELKQEVSNLNQVIESYREKYGDLKNVKNRALENELKECLFWIDQQTRELQMSDFAEDTEPSHSHNVSQIIKNIELQGASRQEMNSIKVELAGLIRRIDNFLAK